MSVQHTPPKGGTPSRGASLDSMPTVTLSQSGAAVGRSDGGYGRQILLCPLLCFLTKKFGRIPMKDLKDIILSFYTVEAVVEAKALLHDALTKLGGEGTPKLTNRRALLDKPDHRIQAI